MEIYPIIDNLLFQSGTITDIHAVKELGITGCINLSERVDNPNVFRMYIYWPIEDGLLPDEEKLMEVANNGFGYIQQGKRLLVRCDAGLNRSGLVVARILLDTFLDMSGRQIVRYIRSKRPMALSNQNFAAYIESFR